MENKDRKIIRIAALGLIGVLIVAYTMKLVPFRLTAFERHTPDILCTNATGQPEGRSANTNAQKIVYKSMPPWAFGKRPGLRAKKRAIKKEEFKWMPVAIRELGVREVFGAKPNSRIVQYLKSTSLSAPANMRDETAWCSGFVNWCVRQAGFDGTESAWSRSWAKWGKKLRTPRRGCIAVFKRACWHGGPETCGHVAFFIAKKGKRIMVLGGNQGNVVSIREYPKADLIEYRIAK